MLLIHLLQAVQPLSLVLVLSSFRLMIYDGALQLLSSGNNNTQNSQILWLLLRQAEGCVGDGLKHFVGHTLFPLWWQADFRCFGFLVSCLPACHSAIVPPSWSHPTQTVSPFPDRFYSAAFELWILSPTTSWNISTQGFGSLAAFIT